MRYNNEIIAREINESNLLDISPVDGFLPNATELLFLKQEADFFVVRDDKGKTGNFESLSIPLPWHLHFNIGKFGFKRKNNKHLFELDTKGNLYLTDFRLVFISKFDNYIVHHKNVLNITNLENGIKIDIEGKNSIQFITGDARLFFVYKKFKQENDKFACLDAFYKQNKF